MADNLGPLLGSYTHPKYPRLEAHDGMINSRPAIVLYEIVGRVAPRRAGYVTYTPVLSTGSPGLEAGLLLSMECAYIQTDIQKRGLSYLLWHQVCRKVITMITARRVHVPPSIIVVHPDPNLRTLWIKSGFDMATAEQNQWDLYIHTQGMDANGFIPRKEMAPGLFSDPITIIRPPAAVTDVTTQQPLIISEAAGALMAVIQAALTGMGRYGWIIAPSE